MGIGTRLRECRDLKLVRAGARAEKRLIKPEADEMTFVGRDLRHLYGEAVLGLRHHADLQSYDRLLTVHIHHPEAPDPKPGRDIRNARGSWWLLDLTADLNGGREQDQGQEHGRLAVAGSGYGSGGGASTRSAMP